MRPSTVTDAVRQRVWQAARSRCGYCLSPQHLLMARLEIEHIVARVLGGSDHEHNLWLSCPLCNRHKASQIAAADPISGARCPLFNPRTQIWQDHFAWSPDGSHIIGCTPSAGPP